MTKEIALEVADMGDNALWRWLRTGPESHYESPAHAREVALGTLAEVIREMDARASVFDSPGAQEGAS